MLAPHELNNKKFPIAIRGYAQSEVNAHISFIIEKYTDIYRKNDELERELLQLRARLEEYESKEDAINRALVSAQRIQERIISDAQLQAQTITDAAKKNISQMLSDFSDKIANERATLHAMIESVSQFKSSMLDEYDKHISLLNAIAPENADPDWDKSDSEYVAKIMNDIRSAAESIESSSDDMQIQSNDISVGMGEFSGLSDDEPGNTTSNQVKRKRPKPTRILKPKDNTSSTAVDSNDDKDSIFVDESYNNSNHSDKSDDIDNFDDIQEDDSLTDEELKRLFSDR